MNPESVNNSAIAKAMRAVVAGGCSIIPIDARTKRPATEHLPRERDGKPTWKPFQEAIVHPHDLDGWCASDLGAYAVVCGEVSGGLIILDFDVPRLYDAWRQAAGELASNVVVQQTGGGGYQAAFRCDYPGANDKLAWIEDDAQDSGRTIGIETRGEGGYAVAPPSLHPTGQRYRVIQGSFASIPKLPQAHADALVDAARKLCECPFTRQQKAAVAEAAKKRVAARKVKQVGTSVIDTFNERYDVVQMLEKNGYRRIGTRMIRPNAENTSEPGVQLFASEKNGRLVSYHWSTNDPLNDGHAHDAFSVFCHFAHGGDVSKAVRAAALELGLDKPKAEEPRKREPGDDDDKEVPPSASIELKGYFGDIHSGKVYAVPWKYPLLSKLTNALLPGTTTCVIGDPGVGKTFLILDNILFWHSGGYRPAVYFIEKNRRFHIQRLLAQLEGNGRYCDDFDWIKENPATFHAAMQKHAAFIDEIGECFHSSDGKRVTMESIRDWIVKMAETGHRVIVVDPITAAFAGEKRWEKDDDFMLGCEATMNAHNASLIVINHSKKGNRQGQATMHDQALGAAFQRFADCNLWIAKPKKPRRVNVMTPCGPNAGEFPIFFQIHKARNAKGTGAEIAFTFGAGLTFAEQGLVTGEAKDTDGDVP